MSGKERILLFRRDFTAERLNRIVNSPGVREHVLIEGAAPVDLSNVVANQNNFALMCDQGGMLFVQLSPGVYDVHTQFLESARGSFALSFAREAVKWMFTRTDCVELWTKVPKANKAALGLTQAMGGRFEFLRSNGFNNDDVRVFSLSYLRWSQKDSSLKTVGEWFHEMLELKLLEANIQEEVHPEDPSHDQAVGATIATIRGLQLDKALIMYNRWASVAGYAPIILFSRWPIVLNIHTCLVELGEPPYEDFTIRGA